MSAINWNRKRKLTIIFEYCLYVVDISQLCEDVRCYVMCKSASPCVCITKIRPNRPALSNRPTGVRKGERILSLGVMPWLTITTTTNDHNGHTDACRSLIDRVTVRDIVCLLNIGGCVCICLYVSMLSCLLSVCHATESDHWMMCHLMYIIQFSIEPYKMGESKWMGEEWYIKRERAKGQY